MPPDNLPAKLREDFPEYAGSIERIELTVSHFSGLARDYYRCKREIIALEQQNKHETADQFRLTLNELKDEIEEFLKKHSKPPGAKTYL